MYFPKRFSKNIYFILTFFIFLLLICVSNKVNAATCSISGTVRTYSTSAPIADANIVVYKYIANTGWTPEEQRAKTGSNGTYTITSLDPGSYRVCASHTNYVIECYESGCASGRDCGYSWFNDPNGHLLTLSSGQNKTNINFYLCQGGHIQGKVYGGIEETPYTIVLEGTVMYKQKPAIEVEDSLGEGKDLSVIDIFIDAENNYFTVFDVPQGEYTLKIRDLSIKNPYIDVDDYRNYYEVFYNNKYSKQMANIITFQHDTASTINYNFQLDAGAFIFGKISDFIDDSRVNTASITARCDSIGFSKTVPSGLVTLFQDGNTYYESGFYILSGLPPGVYTLETREFHCYVTEFYNNARSINDAENINLNKGDWIEQNIALDRYPSLSGWVIEEDLNNCSQYKSDKALEGMKISVLGPYQGLPDPNFTDSEGKFFFSCTHRIEPGTYTIKVSDPDYHYFSFRSAPIQMDINGQYTQNFCLTKASGDISGTISGRVFLDENPKELISGVEMLVLDDTYEIQEQIDSNTNSNGEYTLDIPEPGDYIVFTRSIFNPAYAHLTREIYNDIAILNDDQFIEGNWVITVLNYADLVSVSPGEDVIDIDFGLSSYLFTFYNGLNIFSYPGDPVTIYDTSYELCSLIGPSLKYFAWLNPDTSEWKVTKPSITNPNIMTGNNFPILNGEIYFVVMNETTGPLYIPPFQNTTNPQNNFDVGLNLVSKTSLYHNIADSYGLLTYIGNQNIISNVNNYNNISGKWNSTYWFWKKVCGTKFPVKKGEGYAVNIK